MDKSLRLRLVVRRNGLPDVRVLFNVPLANDPTIATLLELVNDTVPLEDAHGEWGLDDYAVELHDSRGHGFECLHFQPVADLLDRDDEVLYATSPSTYFVTAVILSASADLWACLSGSALSRLSTSKKGDSVGGTRSFTAANTLSTVCLSVVHVLEFPGVDRLSSSPHGSAAD